MFVNTLIIKVKVTLGVCRIDGDLLVGLNAKILAGAISALEFVVLESFKEFCLWPYFGR